MEVDRAGLFVALVAGPWPNRPLVGLVVDIHKARLANGFVHRVDNVAFATGSFATGENVRAPALEDVVRGQSAIITFNTGTGF